MIRNHFKVPRIEDYKTEEEYQEAMDEWAWAEEEYAEARRERDN